LPALTSDRVSLTLGAASLDEAVTELTGSAAPGRRALHIGHGVAVVAATASPVRRPSLRLGRSDAGLLAPDRDDRIHLVFALVMPSDGAGMQREFAAAIAASVESDYVRQRMMTATDPEEVVEVFRDGLCVA
jgi:mannitol/fructose-specific phosphotransferase system IIA component (Ntr-type)